MKTIRDYLEMMDEPEKSQAIENAENDRPCTINDKVPSIYDAINRAFIFLGTKQGPDYWYQILYKYRNR